MPRAGGVTPVEALRSSATLLTQQLLRAHASYQAVGPAHFGHFVSDAVELFSDNHVFVTLQYREVIAHYRERVEAEPLVIAKPGATSKP